MRKELSKSTKIKALVEFLALPKSRENLETVLETILTDKEIGKIYNRVKILDSLDRGSSQRQTIDSIGGGIATVTHGAQITKSPKFKIFAGILDEARLQTWWRKLFWRA